MQRRAALGKTRGLAAFSFLGASELAAEAGRTPASPAATPAGAPPLGRAREALRIRSVGSILVRNPADATPFGELVEMPPVGQLMGGLGVWNRLDHARPSRTPGREQALLVKITTRDGLVGWGEAHAPSAPRVTQRIVSDLFAPVLVGQDARDIEPLWEHLFSTERVRGYFTGAHMEAMAGVDLALWDLLGKALGLPVWQLLGGRFRDRIPLYIGVGGADEATLRENARAALERGFRMVKMGLHKGPGTESLDRVAAVADAVKGRGQVAVDSLGAYKLHEAIKVGRELDRFGSVGWFEDALLAEDVSGYHILAKSLDTPICQGEALSNRFQFRDVFLTGGADIVNPDVCRAGGITECRRIAALADVYGVLWTPHVSTGTLLYVAASAHLAAATSNALIMEGGHKLPGPLGNALAKQPLEMKDGHILVPNRPGFGVEFDEDALRRVTVAG